MSRVSLDVGSWMLGVRRSSSFANNARSQIWVIITNYDQNKKLRRPICGNLHLSAVICSDLHLNINASPQPFFAASGTIGHSLPQLGRTFPRKNFSQAASCTALVLHNPHLSANFRSSPHNSASFRIIRQDTPTPSKRAKSPTNNSPSTNNIIPSTPFSRKFVPCCHRIRVHLCPSVVKPWTLERGSWSFSSPSPTYRLTDSLRIRPELTLGVTSHTVHRRQSGSNRQRKRRII